MNLESKIEAILFFKGEPVSIKKIENILEISEGEALENISNLEKNLEQRGIRLIKKEDKITLGTAPELSVLIENLQKEELNKDLSRSALETLSIVLYKNGATRSEIDYIRGVNSNFILRNLSVRGLIEKEIDEKDNRRHIYKPSFELMNFMGITKIQDLPDFEKISLGLKNKEEEQQNEAQQSV